MADTGQRCVTDQTRRRAPGRKTRWLRVTRRGEKRDLNPGLSKGWARALFSIPTGGRKIDKGTEWEGPEKPAAGQERASSRSLRDRRRGVGGEVFPRVPGLCDNTASEA